MAQTSDRMARLAGKYINVTANEIALNDPVVIAAEIRAMAASLLRQDEHKGLRAKLKDFFTKAA